MRTLASTGARSSAPRVEAGHHAQPFLGDAAILRPRRRRSCDRRIEQRRLQLDDVEDDLRASGRGPEPGQFAELPIDDQPFREEDDRLGRRGQRQPIDERAQRDDRIDRPLASDGVQRLRVANHLALAESDLGGFAKACACPVRDLLKRDAIAALDAQRFGDAHVVMNLRRRRLSVDPRQLARHGGVVRGEVQLRAGARDRGQADAVGRRQLLR